MASRNMENWGDNQCIMVFMFTFQNRLTNEKRHSCSCLLNRLLFVYGGCEFIDCLFANVDF